MKLSQIGVAVVSAMCLAPGARATQHGATYATIEAVTDYCVHVDERHSDEYRKFESLVLASVVNSPDTGDYRAVYDEIRDALNAKPVAFGRAQCASGLGLANSKHDGDDR